MTTPQPNASTSTTGHIPPVVSGPTPLGAVQTMMSSLPPPVASLGAPSAHTTPVSPPEISLGAYAPISVPAHTTHTAADPTAFAPASVSSYGGRVPTPPRETTRDTRYSFPALPEPSHPPPPRPIPLPGVNCFGRLTAHHTDSETIWHSPDDGLNVSSLGHDLCSLVTG
ncbi:hypothetical protein EDB87DRAFT_1261514 [Lactarius vividus]|nr:hypothetical protein EDB87DRAFT_1261514 [Lactarius vividus]